MLFNIKALRQFFHVNLFYILFSLCMNLVRIAKRKIKPISTLSENEQCLYASVETVLFLENAGKQKQDCLLLEQQSRKVGRYRG